MPQKDRKPSRRSIPRAEQATHWKQLLKNPAWIELIAPKIEEELRKRRAPLLNDVDLEDRQSRKRLYEQGAYHALRDLRKWIEKEAEIAETAAFLGASDDDLVDPQLQIRENRPKRGAT